MIGCALNAVGGLLSCPAGLLDVVEQERVQDVRDLQVAVVARDPFHAEMLARGNESVQASFEVLLARVDVNQERGALHLVGKQRGRECGRARAGRGGVGGEGADRFDVLPNSCVHRSLRMMTLELRGRGR